MDEGLSRAVVKVFVELYRAGLIYKDKRLVNWDPKLLTAISDLEVQQIEARGTFSWSRAERRTARCGGARQGSGAQSEWSPLLFRLPARG